MATTPNYGWVTPAPTDFVTDLPADFETFADAVDADLAGLLGGTTGQVLTKDSNADHDFSWQAAGASATNFTLLNSGGTSLSGNTTITISSLSGYNYLYIWTNAASAGASSNITLRLNSDNGNNYSFYGLRRNGDATVQALAISTNDAIPAAGMANNTNNEFAFSMLIHGANAAGYKPYYLNSGADNATDSEGYSINGFYKGTSVISSLSIISSSGNFDQGTIYIYGAN